MTTWSDAQLQFAGAIIGHGKLPGGLCPNYPVSEALDIYRNNYRGNLQAALASAYPVVEKIVGEDFFRMMSRKFIGRHSSQSGNLHLYGAQMGDFIGLFNLAQALPYLADVARLEWACHCAYFAADAQMLDVTKLASIAAENYADLRFLLHPSCTLMQSEYPAATIWHAHQPGMPQEFSVDLDKGHENILISRKNNVVRVQTLTEAECFWLERIKANASLGLTVDLTLERHPGFDLQSTILHLVEQEILTGFELIETQE